MCVSYYALEPTVRGVDLFQWAVPWLTAVCVCVYLLLRDVFEELSELERTGASGGASEAGRTVLQPLWATSLSSVTHQPTHWALPNRWVGFGMKENLSPVLLITIHIFLSSGTLCFFKTKQQAMVASVAKAGSDVSTHSQRPSRQVCSEMRDGALKRKKRDCSLFIKHRDIRPELFRLLYLIFYDLLL